MDEIIGKPAMANWDVWAEMPSSELWQAVLLSIDLSPDDAERAFNWLIGSSHQRRAADSELHYECARRMKIATAHVSFRGPITALKLYSGYEQDPKTKIGLREFSSWATSKGWSLPIKFPSAIPNVAMANSRWPWGSHHTELLGHLDAAARKWWVKYDPTDATTAPTNKDVSEWLVNDRNVSQKMAESIATLLRLDGLPTGPRK